MSDIDWSDAPEGYPLWIVPIEPYATMHRGAWHREDENCYYDTNDFYWSKSYENTAYIVHRKPPQFEEERNATIAEINEVLGFGPAHDVGERLYLAGYRKVKNE